MLDTRQKILTPDQALAAWKGCCVFLAYFDILTVGLIRRIAEAGRPVVAVVLDPPNPVLSARTRAELAAALASVAAVVPVPADLPRFLEALEPDKIVHWESEDAQRTANLIEHVRAIHIAE
jgi:bifunctional ADP-heptose synthase (sugar kinase/adenylyltransferase)